MKASSGPGSHWLREALRGIGFVVLITGSVIVVGAIIATLTLMVVEVSR